MVARATAHSKTSPGQRRIKGHLNTGTHKIDLTTSEQLNSQRGNLPTAARLAQAANLDRKVNERMCLTGSSRCAGVLVRVRSGSSIESSWKNDDLITLIVGSPANVPETTTATPSQSSVVGRTSTASNGHYDGGSILEYRESASSQASAQSSLSQKQSSIERQR